MGGGPLAYNFNGYTLTRESNVPVGGGRAAAWKYKGQELSGEKDSWLEQILAIDKATAPKVPDAADAILREMAGFTAKKAAASGMGLGGFFNPVGAKGSSPMKGVPAITDLTMGAK